MSINRVEISGNLGHDPEVSSTPQGTSVCKLSVCVNDRRRNKRGEWEDVPNWVEVTFFGNRAESIARYLSKGSLVFVAGKLSQRKWTDKDGNSRQRLAVIGEDIQFGGGNPQRGKQQQAPAPQGQHAQGYEPLMPVGQQYVQDDEIFDDIPF